MRASQRCPLCFPTGLKVSGLILRDLFHVSPAVLLPASQHSKKTYCDELEIKSINFAHMKLGFGAIWMIRWHYSHHEPILEVGEFEANRPRETKEGDNFRLD